MKGSNKLYIPVTLILFYLPISVVFFSRFKYCIQVDVISYSSIAKNYLNGDWYNAINAYWSPLISWIMTFFLFFDYSPIHSFKTITILFGIGVIWQMYKILDSKKLPSVFVVTVLAATTVYCLYFSQYFTMPDILSVFFLLLYYRYYKSIFSHRNRAVITGIIAAFCYFTKAYNFVFIILHLTVLIVIKLWSREFRSRTEWVNFGLFLMIFLSFSSIWITAISIKSQKLTTSSSSTFNYTVKMENPHKNKLVYPYLTSLFAPPNQSAVSSWENPALYYDKAQQKSILKNLFSIVQFKVSSKNIFLLGKHLNYYNPLFYAILLATISIFIGQYFSEKRVMLFNSELFKSSLFCAIYPLGYILIFIEGRYIWIIYLLLIYQSILIIETIHKKINLSKLQLYFICSVIFAISVYAPIDQFQVLYRKETLKHMQTFKKAEALHLYIPAGAKVASDLYWYGSNSFSFLNDYKYYGVLANYDDSIQLANDLSKFKPEYLLIYEEQNILRLKNRLSKITPDHKAKPAVYRISYPDE